MARILKTKLHLLKKRAEIIKALSGEGYSDADIAIILYSQVKPPNRSTISNARKNGFRQVRNARKPRESSGRRGISRSA